MAAGITLRLYDYAAANYTERAVGTTATESGVGIAYIEGRIDAIAVVYEVSGAILRTESVDEGNTWSTPVSIATGTYPQLAYCAAQYTEMLCYMNASHAVCVRTKRGTADWSSEIEVCAGADGDTATVTWTSNSRGVVWVVHHQGSGGIARYTSADNGRTWAADT